MTGQLLCQFENVSFRYGDGSPWVFRNVSGAIAEGHWVHLVGSNGLGKTTLLKLFAGLLKPTEGTIHCRFSGPPGVLLTKNGALPHWTVEDALQFWARALNTENAIDGVVHLLGIASFKKFKMAQLSSGWQRRVAYARVLLKPRQFYILDECWNFLDESARHALGAYFQKRRSEGAAIICSSHESPIESASQRWVISNGGIVCH